MIPLAKQNIDFKALGSAIETVMKSGWWTTGKVTQQLEEEFADYIGTKYAVATNSCSMALIMSIRVALEQQKHKGCPNDRVIVSPLTFVSTVNAILFNNLVPFFVDVKMDTLNIDEERAVEIINEGSNKYSQCIGILPVHFGGNSCNMDILCSLDNSIFIVEDCAHAVETKWKGRHVGIFGLCGCYSFNPTKNLFGTEMGMVTTNDGEVAKKLQLLRCHGMDQSSFDRVEKKGDYDVSILGYKANPTDIEAAVSLLSLRQIGQDWFLREDIAFVYGEFFDEMIRKGLFNGDYFPNNKKMIPPFVSKKNVHGLHLFQITINNRDKFIQEMKKRKVYCGIHYKPVHLHSYYMNKYGYTKGNFPNSEWLGEHLVTLPLGAGMSLDDQEYVCDQIEKLFETGEYLL